jgi:hypothetical protein
MISLLCIAAAVLVQPPQAHRGLFQRADALLTENRLAAEPPYRDGGDTPLHADGYYRNAAKTETVDYSISEIPSGRKESIVWLYTHGSAVDQPESNLSDRPLAEHCWSDAFGPRFRVHAIGDRYLVWVTVTAGPKPGNEDRLRWARLFSEKLARTLLADAMALDLTDTGSTVSGAPANKQGYTTLSNWASEKHLDLVFDDESASVRFGWHGKTVRLYLASNKAKVDDAFVPMGGKFILARGNTWFVPRAELEAAIGP